MKKIALVAATILALAFSQAQPARAGAFPVAAGVVGGLAVGAAIGATVAHPAYYAPGPYVAPAPVYPYCYAPAPRVVVAPPVVVGPPFVRFGWGFGRPYYHGFYGHPRYFYRGRW